MASTFDAGGLRRLTFVGHLEIHDALGSTNDRAAELARDNSIALPALVVARRQTAGRGRGQHTWWGADGALTFSLLLDQASTGVAPSQWPQLSLAIAVAICDALSAEIGRGTNPPSERSSPALAGNLRFDLAIKWPNDVLLGGRKISGILIESPGGGAPAKDRLIVGIGVNVNNSWQEAPSDVGTSGTALCDVTGQKHDLQTLLVEVLALVNCRIEQLRRRERELIDSWQQLNYLAGRRVAIESDSRRIDGSCERIADDGALVVDTPRGRQHVYSGSIRLALI